MTDDRIPMTREGYDKLKAELDRLRNAEMIEITKRVAVLDEPGPTYDRRPEATGSVRVHVGTISPVARRVGELEPDAFQEAYEQFLAGVQGDLRTISHRQVVSRSEALDGASQAATAAYLCFVREDAIPVDGWAHALVDALDRDAGVGAVCARSITSDGHALPAESWLVGVVRREAFEAAGGFSGSARPLRSVSATLLEAIRELGWSVRIEPTAVALVGRRP
jgi:hypothetical protein